MSHDHWMEILSITFVDAASTEQVDPPVNERKRHLCLISLQ